jgi:hypothetical protein
MLTVLLAGLCLALIARQLVSLHPHSGETKPCKMVIVLHLLLLLQKYPVCTALSYSINDWVGA